MKIKFISRAKKHYLYWAEKDKKILKKINDLIEDIQKEPFDGIGKPEPLRNELSGWWSRRITHEHRLVYKVKEEVLYILQCRFHY